MPPTDFMEKQQKKQRKSSGIHRTPEKEGPAVCFAEAHRWAPHGAGHPSADPSVPRLKRWDRKMTYTLGVQPPLSYIQSWFWTTMMDGTGCSTTKRKANPIVPRSIHQTCQMQVRAQPNRIGRASKVGLHETLLTALELMRFLCSLLLVNSQRNTSHLHVHIRSCGFPGKRAQPYLWCSNRAQPMNPAIPQACPTHGTREQDLPNRTAPPQPNRGFQKNTSSQAQFHHVFGSRPRPPKSCSFPVGRLGPPHAASEARHSFPRACPTPRAVTGWEP